MIIDVRFHGNLSVADLLEIKDFCAKFGHVTDDTQAKSAAIRLVVAVAFERPIPAER